MIVTLIIYGLLIEAISGVPQRCDKTSKVCQKLELDDPIFAGQRCEVPSDCKDEYNPYCSKWGYCISYNLFGEEGPGQSKGAVEDGTRGQCRTDKDCTPWAPSCSPLGYCRGSPEEWDWDGSHGAPSNPKPGSEQSDWVKQNAKSGGGRNEDYYKTIEDDNRAAHVKFRKDNPIFYEQIPELLPRLEKIENNVYKPCTYCTYDPKSDGEYQDLVTRLSDANQRKGNGNGHGNGNGGSRKKSAPRQQRRQQNNNRKNNNRTPQSNNRKSNNRRTQSNNRKTQNGSNNRRTQTNNRKNNGNSNGRRPQSNGNKQQCPGGALQKCNDVCESFKARTMNLCKAACTKRC